MLGWRTSTLCYVKRKPRNPTCHGNNNPFRDLSPSQREPSSPQDHSRSQPDPRAFQDCTDLPRQFLLYPRPPELEWSHRHLPVPLKNLLNAAVQEVQQLKLTSSMKTIMLPHRMTSPFQTPPLILPKDFQSFGTTDNMAVLSLNFQVTHLSISIKSKEFRIKSQILKKSHSRLMKDTWTWT